MCINNECVSVCISKCVSHCGPDTCLCVWAGEQIRRQQLSRLVTMLLSCAQQYVLLCVWAMWSTKPVTRSVLCFCLPPPWDDDSQALLLPHNFCKCYRPGHVGMKASAEDTFAYMLGNCVFSSSLRAFSIYQWISQSYRFFRVLHYLTVE